MPLSRRYLAIGFRALALAPVLAACSVAPEGVEIHDPYESLNRRVHAFNASLDTGLFGAGTDDTVVPEELSIPVQNFADNVALPGMVLNGVLQGDIEGVVTNTLRFVLNTVIGVGGLFDPADAIGVTERSTDFGETLAVWGVPEGAYLELPVLGPSTERDALGQIVDWLIDPLDRVGTPMQRDYATAMSLSERFLDRYEHAATIESLLYDSADSYAQARLLYLQNRRFELGDAPGAGTTGTFIDPFEDMP